MLSYKKWAFLVAALAVASFSCEKEEAPLDLEVPSVSLEVSGNPENLFGEISLTAVASDNDGIEKVVFYAGSESIGEDTEEPFELKWNSRTVEDGPYMLKAVAYDLGGNEAENSKEVFVRHTLLKVTVEDNYIPESGEVTRREWLYLSDAEGNIVGEPTEVASGVNMSWERPADFLSEVIYLNHFTENTNETKSLYALNIYTDFSSYQGLLKALPTPGSSSPSKSTQITISNDFDGSELYTFQADLRAFPNRTTSANSQETLTPRILKEKDFAFLTYSKGQNHFSGKPQNELPKYYWMEAEVEQQHEVHTSDFFDMQERIIEITTEDYTSAYLMVFGYKEEMDTRYIGYQLLSSSMLATIMETSFLTAYQPGDLFTKYLSYGSVHHQEYVYSFFTKGGFPAEIRKPDFNLNVTNLSLDAPIQIRNTGNQSITTLEWAKQESTTALTRSFKISLHINGQSTQENFNLPVIPEVIRSQYPFIVGPVDHSLTLLSDYQNIDSYKSYLNDIWGAEQLNTRKYHYRKLQLKNAKPGGRALSSGHDHSDDFSGPEIETY